MNLTVFPWADGKAGSGVERPSVPRRRSGDYDPSHHMIVLSKILDQTEVPRLAVEYVMFHEMLHLRYPVDHKGSRRCVHTPEFKAAEKASSNT